MTTTSPPILEDLQAQLDGLGVAIYRGWQIRVGSLQRLTAWKGKQEISGETSLETFLVHIDLWSRHERT